MTYDQIVAVLGYAGSHERAVRIVTTDRQEVTGIPTAVDPHETAHEVFLHPVGDESTEIAMSLGAIAQVELL
ncbi:MAG TPA: hypothetical protein VNJ71_02435 [Gemmatimonadales bacterium]|jgi:hypothetical protein|nr:hypothetical protein [Gemmatimonadales bacterium]